MTTEQVPPDALVVYSADIHAKLGDGYHTNKLSVVLSQVKDPDACLLGYTTPGRLGAKDASAEITMQWCAVDQDCAPVKAWRKANPGEQLPAKLQEFLDMWRVQQYALAATFPVPCAMWDSNSGVRQLRALTPGVTALDYDVRCAAFLQELRDFGFDGVDETSAQWSRHQRLPRGRKVTGWPGYLELPPAPEGFVPSVPLAGVGDSDVWGCLNTAMYLDAIEDGVPGLEMGEEEKTDFLQVRCPWDSEHSNPGEPLNQDCCITACLEGKGLGGLACFHGHSGGDPNVQRDGAGLRQWLAERSPLAAARLRAFDTGCPDPDAADALFDQLDAEEPPPPASTMEGDDLPVLKFVGAADLAKPLPPVNWLCRRMSLAPGRPVQVSGKFSSGKTLGVQALALAVAAGAPAFGSVPVRQGPVRHIDLDQGGYATRHRYQQLAVGMGLDLAKLDLGCFFFDFRMTKSDGYRARLDPVQVAILERSVRGTALVIIDALRGLAPGMDENDSEFGEILQALSGIAHRLGDAAPTFIVLHHAGRSESNAGGRGTSAIDDRSGSKWVAALDREKGEVTWTQWKPSELSLRGLDTPFATRLERGPLGANGEPEWVRVEIIPETMDKDTGAEQAAAWESKVLAAVEAVRATPGIGRSILKGKIGGKHDDAPKVIDALVGASADCMGHQIWPYGSQPERYYPKSAEDMILGVLQKGAALPATLAAETCLPKQLLTDTLEHLRGKGRISFTAGVAGAAAWELSRI